MKRLKKEANIRNTDISPFFNDINKHVLLNHQSPNRVVYEFHKGTSISMKKYNKFFNKLIVGLIREESKMKVEKHKASAQT